MAEESSRQPLLAGLLDPSYSRNKCLSRKKRLRRTKSAPSTDIPMECHDNGALLPSPKLIFGISRPSFTQIFIFLGIYLGVGAICFYLVKDQLAGKKTNGVLDAIYFCIVTMTTVGYGDLVPNSVLAKLLACVFVFTGMAIIALLLSKAADYLVEKQEILLYKTLHRLSKHGEAQEWKAIETNKVRYKFYTISLFLVVLMIAGTIFLWKVEKLDFVDAFYCVCCTITTLGYGDKSFSTEGGRLFAVFWIISGSICLAQFFFYLTELNAEQRQKMLANWVVHRKVTNVDLEAADVDDDGVVDAAEFVIYKLKELGKISEEDISLFMKEFEELDFDESGTLSPSDLVLSQNGR